MKEAGRRLPRLSQLLFVGIPLVSLFNWSNPTGLGRREPFDRLKLWDFVVVVACGQVCVSSAGVDLFWIHGDTDVDIELTRV